MKFHINPETGVTSNCDAKGVENGGRDCKFIHGNSPKDAQRNLEKILSDVTIVSLKRAREMTDGSIPDSLTGDELRKMATSSILSTPLKDLNTSHLIQDINARAVMLGMDSEQISSAISLASILHATQVRQVRGKFKIVPYIEHPLRNTSRLMRAGITDQNVIIGSLLHDTIEDGSLSFMSVIYNKKTSDIPEAREALSNYIDKAYGSEVLDIVTRVTNEYRTRKELETRTAQQKRDDYRIHVQEGISGHKGAYLVKISDYLDNAGSLQHQIKDVAPEQVDKFKRIAAKYKPMIQVFQDEMNQGFNLDEGAVKSDIGDKTITEYLSKRLLQIDKSLDEILAK